MAACASRSVIRPVTSQPPGQQSLGSISGTVLDINERTVPEARITLVNETSTEERVALSDSEGHFTFTNLAPGRFKLTITSAGLRTFVSSDVLLHPGEKHELQRVALPVASTAADIQVTVTENEIAQEQIKAEEKQRVFGVFPNFYTSYIWDAAPLSSKQKFQLATRAITDPVDFLSSGIVAGVEQARNTYPGYDRARRVMRNATAPTTPTAPSAGCSAAPSCHRSSIRTRATSIWVQAALARDSSTLSRWRSCARETTDNCSPTTPTFSEALPRRHSERLPSRRRSRSEADHRQRVAQYCRPRRRQSGPGVPLAQAHAKCT